MLVSWKEVLRLKEKTHSDQIMFCASQQFAFYGFFLASQQFLLQSTKSGKSLKNQLHWRIADRCSQAGGAYGNDTNAKLPGFFLTADAKPR
ncbi:hypothetical protein RY831_28290 [Noviherbaspirillum sp. CPCC 100848]|uniref:Uncharacterized protein n=1 Tax=Noviherbaspirillum album TaxID=3080276 RepID=A0ABU6JHB5_9BURK|nr:hypothetical protein [Noviherbaspirillum sp. CPCC 100848]MEC4723065.1 hypothetical protein [Noviherbaspirillum sp. CPCC 100848]